MKRSQNQGKIRKRNILQTQENTSYLLYPNGRIKTLKTIWKANRLHDDVIDKSKQGI